LITAACSSRASFSPALFTAFIAPLGRHVRGHHGRRTIGVSLHHDRFIHFHDPIFSTSARRD
jgi:hypothetical protein